MQSDPDRLRRDGRSRASQLFPRRNLRHRGEHFGWRLGLTLDVSSLPMPAFTCRRFGWCWLRLGREPG